MAASSRRQRREEEGMVMPFNDDISWGVMLCGCREEEGGEKRRRKYQS